MQLNSFNNLDSINKFYPEAEKNFLSYLKEYRGEISNDLKLELYKRGFMQNKN